MIYSVIVFLYDLSNLQYLLPLFYEGDPQVFSNAFETSYVTGDGLLSLRAFLAATSFYFSVSGMYLTGLA